MEDMAERREKPSQKTSRYCVGRTGMAGGRKWICVTDVWWLSKMPAQGGGLAYLGHRQREGVCL